MTIDEIKVRVAGARSYAERHRLLYVPCFKKAFAGPDAPWRDDPLGQGRAIKTLEDAGIVPQGTFDRYSAGRALPPELAPEKASWCRLCKHEPAASADGVCLWCEQPTLSEQLVSTGGRGA